MIKGAVHIERCSLGVKPAPSGRCHSVLSMVSSQCTLWRKSTCTGGIESAESDSRADTCLLEMHTVVTARKQALNLIGSVAVGNAEPVRTCCVCTDLALPLHLCQPSCSKHKAVQKGLIGLARHPAF